MYKIIASLYRFNKRGANKSIPHCATLTNILIIFFLIVFILISLLDAKDILKFWHTGSRGGDYIVGAVVVLPVYALLWLLFPERKMREQEALLTKKEYRYGLGAYVVLFIILMFIFFAVIGVEI